MAEDSRKPAFSFTQFSSWDEVPLENLIHPNANDDVDELPESEDREYEISKMKLEIKHLKLELSSLQSSFSILENEKQKSDEKILRYKQELKVLMNEKLEMEDRLYEEKRINDDLEKKNDEHSSELLHQISVLEDELRDMNIKLEEEKAFNITANKFSKNDDIIIELRNQVKELTENQSKLQLKLDTNDKYFQEKESKYMIEIENLKLKNENIQSLPPIPRSLSNKNIKLDDFDFEGQFNHLESVILKLENALEEKNQIATNALKQLQEKQEEEEAKRLKHLEDLEALNAVKEQLQSQIEPLSKEKNALTSLISQLEVKDWNHPGHSLKLRKNPNFGCTACRRTGSGWCWKCTNPICKDCMHLTCAK